MTSWCDPDRDDGYAKYEREDALTPEQARQELEDQLERPYGASRPKLPHVEKMTPKEWYDKTLGPYRCTRCGKENDDSGCDFCGAVCRRQWRFT